jgi:outer membrane autotransporter protein
MNYFVSLTLCVCLLQLSGIAQAGSLVNGEWKTSNCGQKPMPPALDVRDIDAYNKSVTAVNEWQQQSGTYFECQVKEANDDNKVIAEKANAEQAYYRKTLESIGATLEAGKNKLK